ncbi:Modifier of protein aggregation [Trichinella spiralis]|uniref:Modifier of protein aggregation n=1 Tax=Trichinella spiralis TaxID=6334 RepID=A0ABR3L1M8_TRISP
MTRGNQRDLAREKAQKKQRQQQKNQAASEKSGNKGIITTLRLEIPDQRIMRFSAHDKWTQVIVRTNAEFIFPEEQLAACEMKWNFSTWRSKNTSEPNCIQFEAVRGW